MLLNDLKISLDGDLYPEDIRTLSVRQREPKG